MRFQTPLVPATLIQRYKRFLADIRLDDGRAVTAHCPNPGSMLGLRDAGARIWVEPNDDPKKKLKFGWRLSETEQGLVTVDTGLANRVVAEALAEGAIPEFAAYTNVRPEVKYSDNSRIDFLLTGDGLPDCYVEVKSVTLHRAGTLAEFPDSKTARGAKHLGDLSAMVDQGHRAVMLYLVQNTACDHMTLAADIDPAYAAAYTAARASGIETLCYDTTISTDATALGKLLGFTAP